MSSGPPLRARFSILLLTALLFGCGSDGPAAESEWTIQEGALTLTETLRAGDDEPYFFGEIGDVTAQSDGRIYVADDDAAHVKVLAPNGTLQDTIGRKGEGPGEFQDPEQLVLARGDSLYVVDENQSELSVFAPNHTFAYRMSLRFLPRKRVLLLPEKVLPRQSSPGYVIRYSVPFMPGNDEQTEDKTRTQEAVRTVSADGTAGDTLLTVPTEQEHVEQGRDYVRVRQIPYGRGPFVTMGPESHLHYAWSDSLGVRTYEMDGTLQRTVDIPFEPVPVTETDREQALADYSKKRRAAVEDEIPTTKPAFDQFLVDDEGHYWFGRPTANPDSTNWWVADPEQKRVVTTTLPSDVRLHKVTNGRAYGQTTTENGAPALVRYRIHIDN